MKKTLAFAVLFLGASVMTACDNSPKVTATDLMHHNYELVSINGIDAPSDQITIEFGENLAISGKMCNRFFGQATLEGNVLNSPGLAMTKMFCEDEELNKLDSMINELLINGATVTLENNSLVLANDNNELIYQISDFVQ